MTTIANQGPYDRPYDRPYDTPYDTPYDRPYDRSSDLLYDQMNDIIYNLNDTSSDEDYSHFENMAANSDISGVFRPQNNQGSDFLNTQIENVSMTVTDGNGLTRATGNLADGLNKWLDEIE